MPKSSPATEHLESDTEYLHRVQDQITADSWQGVDTVGAASYPPRAIVHDLEPDADDTPHVYNFGRKHKGY